MFYDELDRNARELERDDYDRDRAHYSFSASASASDSANTDGGAEDAIAIDPAHAGDADDDDDTDEADDAETPDIDTDLDLDIDLKHDHDHDHGPDYDRAASDTASGQTVHRLDPSVLTPDPYLSGLRDWTGSSAHELSIPDLAATMLAAGQIEPCRAYPGPGGIPIVYVGQRRLAAATYNVEHGHPGFRLEIIIDAVTPDQAFRRALTENYEREDHTVVEKARHVRMARDRYGWKKAQEPKLCEFFGVSPATIHSIETLGRAPKDILDRIAAGTLTEAGALDLMLLAKKVTGAGAGDKGAGAGDSASGKGGKGGKDSAKLTPAEQAAVLEKADELAAADPDNKADAKPKNKSKSGAKDSRPTIPTPDTMREQRERHKLRLAWQKSGKPRPTCCALHHEIAFVDNRPCKGEYTSASTSMSSSSAPAPTGPGTPGAAPTPSPTPSAAKPPTRAKHIRQASQQVLGDTLDKTRSPKLSEAVAIWRSLADDADSPFVMRSYMSYSVRWAKGEKGTSDKGLRAAWEDIADALAKPPNSTAKKSATPKAKAKPAPTPALKKAKAKVKAKVEPAKKAKAPKSMKPAKPAAAPKSKSKPKPVSKAKTKDVPVATTAAASTTATASPAAPVPSPASNVEFADETRSGR